MCVALNSDINCYTCATNYGFAEYTYPPEVCVPIGISSCDYTCTTCADNDNDTACTLCSLGYSFNEDSILPDSCEVTS